MKRHSCNFRNRWFGLSRLAALGCILAGGMAIGTYSIHGALQDPPAEEKKAGEGDLSERLLRKSKVTADGDVMSEILRLMNESSHRLEVRFDPGDETQAVQKSILDKLKDAIEQAAMQRRITSSSSQSTSGERRKMEEPSPGEPAESTETTEDAGQAADARGSTSETSPGETEMPSGRLIELRRSWGNLPLRDRDEIIQGVGEASLERYREWINRYYQALQEAEE